MILQKPYNPHERDGLKYIHHLRNYCTVIKKPRCLLLPFLLIILQSANAQNNSGYKIFERTPLGQLHINIPQPATFQPVTITPAFPSSRTNPIPGGLPGNNFLSSDVQQQNQRVLQMHNAIANGGGHGSLPPDIQQDMEALEQEARYNEWMARTQYYRQAYSDLLHLNPDSFSITKAVYLVENAWYRAGGCEGVAFLSAGTLLCPLCGCEGQPCEL
ncbi:hypothetical protein [Agriterribacter sp.]|uniref:hypothetical protein n=1 Tax=Agriterribacter sp. TaxID=2821509 RepID=UPI002C531DAA|nr:hypothetical protein [Agriterribacter sp.]HRP55734.1 hypothetical protein [Agriterribacter sp.]